MDVPHEVFNKWCEYCIRRCHHIPFERWAGFTMSGEEGGTALHDYLQKLNTPDEMTGVVYLIRQKTTGRYWLNQRTNWVLTPMTASSFSTKQAAQNTILRAISDSMDQGDIEIVTYAFIEMANDFS